MSAAPLIMAFLMGLTGSLHCAGMCGAIVWVMPFQAFTGPKRLLAVAMYHLSRISVYALMAIVLFSFRSLFNPQVQQVISVSLGSILLLAGVLSFLPGILKLKATAPWSGFVTSRLSSLMGNPGLGGISAAGALNGLLPCGLVYMALSATLSLPGLPQVIAFVYTFGFGTMPLLVAITLLKGRFKFRLPAARRIVPAIMFLFGAIFILRGLNLGIPYLSPKVAVSQGKVIHSCCHKK